MKLTRIPQEGYEQVVRCEDPDSGLKALIAIHDTTLGPALGGLRMWPYASEDDALFDVLRLSRGMTYKSAVAETGLGGGKSVIIGDPRWTRARRSSAPWAGSSNTLERPLHHRRGRGHGGRGHGPGPRARRAGSPDSRATSGGSRRPQPVDRPGRVPRHAGVPRGGVRVRATSRAGPSRSRARARRLVPRARARRGGRPAPPRRHHARTREADGGRDGRRGRGLRRDLRHAVRRARALRARRRS